MSIRKYNPEKHHRRSIRLHGYDYSQEGLYFITICVQNRENIFGDISNGIMNLNAIGKIAADEWLNTLNVRDNIELHEFIIMPNHIHGIIEITKKKATTEENTGFRSPKQTIGSVVRGYKIATLKKIKDHLGESGSKSVDSKGGSKGELQFAPTFAPTIAPTIWQRNYYEHIIKDEKAYQNISNYIITNPQRWNEDKFHK